MIAGTLARLAEPADELLSSWQSDEQADLSNKCSSCEHPAVTDGGTDSPVAERHNPRSVETCGCCNVRWDGTEQERTKVLNLYAGLGGNRKLWEDVDVVAVEKNPKVAAFYADQFPGDDVVVGDAHTFLENHHREDWDFIWASPPCQTHTRFNTLQWNSDSKRNRDREPRYPDMRLYQEIILLENFARCDWVVENVTSYYEPLIPPQRVDRHYLWSNRHIPDFEGESLEFQTQGKHEFWAERYGFDVDGVDLGMRKDQALKNCVDPELGKHIFEAVVESPQQTLVAAADGGEQA